jgi:hypothetical protein
MHATVSAAERVLRVYLNDVVRRSAPRLLRTFFALSLWFLGLAILASCVHEMVVGESILGGVWLLVFALVPMVAAAVIALRLQPRAPTTQRKAQASNEAQWRAANAPGL